MLPLNYTDVLSPTRGSGRRSWLRIMGKPWTNRPSPVSGWPITRLSSRNQCIRWLVLFRTPLGLQSNCGFALPLSSRIAPTLSLAHHSDYAEPFTGSSFNHALTAVELGIIRDSA